MSGRRAYPGRAAREIAARLSPGEIRFVLAGSARRAKSYATLLRHARGGDGGGLGRLFDEVREDRRRREPRFVLSDLGLAVKWLHGGRI